MPPRSAQSELTASRRSAEIAENKLRAAKAEQQARLLTVAATMLGTGEGGKGRKRGAGGPPVRPTPVQVLGVPGRDYSALSGSYQAAKPDRSRPGPTPMAAAADAHLDENTHDQLRRFCQDVYRNIDTAGMLVDRLADAVVGNYGPILMCLSEDEEFNKQAEDYFWQWSQQPEVTGQLTLADLLRDCIADLCQDGDIGYLLTKNMKVQAVEGERIVNPRGKGKSVFGGGAGATAKNTANGNTIIRGVEFGPAGEPVAFHVAGFSESGRLDKSKTTAVSAESMFLARNPFSRKTNQTRGVPVLARSVTRLAQFEEYQNSALMAAIMGAMAAMLIKTNNPDQTERALRTASEQDQGSEDGTSSPITDLSPGMVAYLKPTESMEQFKPEHPTTSFDAFATFQIRLIGAGIGLPIELTLLDSSKSNYYGTRAALASTYRGLAPWRRVVISICNRLYRWVIGDAIDRGRIKFVSDWAKTDWICQPPPMIKVIEELNGIADGVDRGIWTRNEGQIMATGGTFRDWLPRRMREIQAERAAGWAPVTMPGAGGGGGGGAGGAGGAGPAKKKAPENDTTQDATQDDTEDTTDNKVPDDAAIV